MKILIVCTGNTCRSPMAEGIFNELKKDTGLNIQVLSAGISADEGSPISENAITAMADVHDIAHYRAKMVNEDLIHQADIILTMTRVHKDRLISRYKGIEEKTYLLNAYAYGIEEDVEDPFGGDLEIYNSARNKIYNAVQSIINKLKE